MDPLIAEKSNGKEGQSHQNDINGNASSENVTVQEPIDTSNNNSQPLEDLPAAEAASVSDCGMFARRRHCSQLTRGCRALGIRMVWVR